MLPSLPLPVISALFPLLSLPLTTLAHPSPDGSHNPHNPYRAALKREVTTDVTRVNGRSFDFVIAGGGCAGLALGSRLSEWSNVTVLVIEAGADGSEFQDRIDIPGYAYLRGLGDTTFDWGYNTVPQADALNLVKKWPRGKGLGGSGAVNGLYWCKGDQNEYDAWGQLNPNAAQTWNWQEMQKYMKKCETYTAPSAAVRQQFGNVIDPNAGGTSGPIAISITNYIYPLVANWIPSWINLGLQSKDLLAGDTHGVTINPSTINPSNSSRSDSKAAYIDPLPPRSNLVILTGQQVTQVVFNGSTDASGNIVASGVRFQAARGSTAYSVQANKEVILAGGTIGSAQLLQLSGIGPTDLLSRFGIERRLDLPVGHNLQDHVSVAMYWSTPSGTVTWREMYNADLQAQALAQWRANGTGKLTYVNNAMGYVNLADITGTATTASTYAAAVQSQLAQTVTDVTSWLVLPSTVTSGIRKQYNIMQSWLTQRIGQLEVLLHTLGNADNTLGIQIALQHPWTRGTIFINSTDPFQAPSIDPHYFGVGFDTDIMSYGLEFARKLARTAPLSTLFVTETTPGAGTTGDALYEYAWRVSTTEYHPIGTASMLPREDGGVVDTNLIVYGSSNLRVIDASIMPLHITAHTMASVYGIAEKGADIIKQKYMAVQPITSSGTAAPGTATDGAVTSNPSATAAGAGGQRTSSGLSSAATIGIGVGAGVAGAILLAAIIAFCCIRKKRKEKQVAEKGWYAPAASGEGAQPFRGGGGYAMNDLMAAPTPPYAHERKMSASPSINSMETYDMASRTPQRVESGYGLSALAAGEVPYRDSTDTRMADTRAADFAPGTGDERYGQPSWTVRPQEQRYVPVNIR